MAPTGDEAEHPLNEPSGPSSATPKDGPLGQSGSQVEAICLGQFRAIVRKAEPTIEELGALAQACLKLGLDPGPLYLRAQRDVHRPAGFARLPSLAQVFCKRSMNSVAC